MMLKYGSDAIPPRPKTVREKAAEMAALTEEEKRKRQCCFTGHRPEKLSRPVDDIKIDLENEIIAAIREGYRTFITGMARGTDIWAGNIVVRLKEDFPDLRLIAAVPFPSFSKNWDPEWQSLFRTLLDKADLVRTICPKYSFEVYQIRNQWMINHSSKMIAIYDGKAGGTRNALQYAGKCGLQIRCLPG